MHRRKLTVLALAAAAVAAVGLTGASGATGQHGQFRTIAGGTITGTGSSYVPLALSNKMTTYILEMSAKPVAVVDAASKAAGHGRLSFAQRATLTRQIMSQQAPVVAAVNRLSGAHVTYQFQGVYNGIAVMLPQRDVWKLGSISGVKAIFATHQYKRASVAPGDGIPLVNAPQTWGGTGAYSGAGMKIADLDTGIDYTHADFGGTGTTAAYNCAAAHSTDDAATFAIDCPGVSNWYSGLKVKGGTDLVGNCYDAGGKVHAGCPNGAANLIPQPDTNPLDCNGHGTHTAGTAAGFGVDGSGNTYTGAYNANTINNNSFIIPPGVAPKASLYAVRVFGCNGSVNDAVLIDAMNWAFNNGMDVVNMSLGAPFGSPTDPDAVAANNLANEGVIVVESSGNSGPNPYLTGSPAAGVGGISVAANDSTAGFPGANLTLSTGPVLSAMNANGVTISPATYNVHVIWANPANHALGLDKGCSVAADEASNGGNPYASTDILIVKRGTCARVGKAVYAQQSGAGAVVMVNTATSLPPYEGPITSNPDTGLPYTVTIPFLGVTGGSNPNTSANGAALIAADGGTIALAANAGIANVNYKGLASFTSWGPSSGSLLKPEVTAPGVSIISAGNGAGNGGIFLSGTSMAAPHTSGMAALVKQAHPSWGSVALWKDAIVNTANPANVLNYAIRGAGAGEIDAYNATHTKVVADSSSGTTPMNCGLQYTMKKVDCQQTITLHNMSGAPATFLVTATNAQGVIHSVHIKTPDSWAPKKVRVAANSTATVTVDLIVYRGKVVDPVGQFNDYWGSGKFDEASGLIHFTPLDGSNSKIALNVPYYALPTMVSNVAINGLNSAALKGGATDSNVVLTNQKAGVGYADWFLWGGSSPVSGTDIGSADLLNDGVASTGYTGTMAGSFVTFALQTNKPWTNPAESVAEIDVDVNNDGIPDYAILAYDNGAWQTGSSNGQSVVVAYNLHTNAWAIHYLTGAMFNGTTMELPVQFADLCTSGAPCVTDGTAIHYSTFMSDRNGGQDSITTNAAFDVFHPTLVNNGSDTIGRSATVTDPTSLDATAWAANPQLGLLVLMQNNQGGAEAATFNVHP